jgi:hypothetical protein
MAIYDTMQFIPCDVSTFVEIKFRATHAIDAMLPS